MANRLLGVISALPEELAHLSDRSAETLEIGGLAFWRGEIGGREAVFVESGAGKVNAGVATALLLDRFECRALLLCGVAGGLDPALGVGDVVVGISDTQHDYGVHREDGFLTITDRLSRFSKIGGEMVPHGKVEEALQQAAGAELQVFAVTGLPDEKKGERLAVLYTIDEATIPAVLDKLAASGLPNLFIPAKSQFVKVDALPILGTGKLDLRGVKRIAMERLAADGTRE